MGDEILFKISDLKSGTLQNVANSIDSISANPDSAIDQKEAEALQSIFNSNAVYNAELAKESESIQGLLGYEFKGTTQNKEEVSATSKTSVQETEETDDSEDDEVSSDSSVKSESKSKANSPYEELLNEYYQYRGIDRISREPLEGSKSLSPQAAYEAVVDKHKGDKTYKKALKNLKKYSIDTEARLEVIDAIAQSDATKSKEVKKDAREYLEAKYGKLDKHLKKALNGKGHSFWANTFNWLSGRDSGMKKIRKAQAYGNRAEERASEENRPTKQDMTKAIGKRSPLFKVGTDGLMAIEKLEYPYINRDENGNRPKMVTKVGDKYDISLLSEFISKHVGADNTLSRQENNADSELEAIRSKLSEQGLKLTKRDTKQLVEFCGYKVQGKNLVKTIVDGTIGAAAAAIGTGIALKTQAPQVFTAAPENNVNMHFEFKSEGGSIGKIQVDKDFQKMIDSGAATLVETASSVIIDVKHTDVVPFTHIAKKHIGLNMLKAAGIGALTGIAAGLLEYGPSEKNVFHLGFLSESDCNEVPYNMTFEDFCKHVDGRKELKDLQKQALKQIAYAFLRDDDSWDSNSFKNYMFKKAGNSSDLNEIELLRAVQDAPDCLKEEKVVVKKKEENEEEEKVDDKKDDSDNNEDDDDDNNCPTCTPKTGNKPFEIHHKWNREGGESWIEIVKAKYPCMFEELQKAGVDPYSRNGAIKRMQRAIATDADGKFQDKQFQAIKGGDIPAHIDFPDEIEFEVNGKKLKCKYEDNPVVKKSQKELRGKGGSAKSNNGSYGYGRKGNKRTYTDDCHPKIVGEGNNDAEAKADFDRKVKQAQGGS